MPFNEKCDPVEIYSWAAWVEVLLDLLSVSK